MHALEAIRLVAAHLRDSVAEPGNYELRAQIMLASLQAGLAFSNASLGSVHTLANLRAGHQKTAHECSVPITVRVPLRSGPMRSSSRPPANDVRTACTHS
jgi:alcohol dehydrogenase class IV